MNDNLKTVSERTIARGKCEVLNKFRNYIEKGEKIISKDYYIIGLKRLQEETEKEYHLLYDQIQKTRDRDILLFYLEQKHKGANIIFAILQNNIELERISYLYKEVLITFLDFKINKNRR